MFTAAVTIAVVFFLLSLVVTALGKSGMGASHEGGMISFFLFFIPGLISLIGSAAVLISMLVMPKMAPEMALSLSIAPPVLGASFPFLLYFLSMIKRIG